MHAFMPETINTMSRALDCVCAELDRSGKTHYSREVIAKRILSFAASGERDIDSLVRAVLARPSAQFAYSVVKDRDLWRWEMVVYDVLAAAGVRETRKGATAAAISAVLNFKPH
jgi:hypothetical protein